MSRDESGVPSRELSPPGGARGISPRSTSAAAAAGGRDSRSGRAAEGRVEGAAAPRRLTSLDVFRGATIAGMLVVNTPGTWDHVFPPLLHAEWHGWTYTDTIFPFFLFIVGVSMAFSFGRRRANGEKPSALSLHTLRRAAIIFLLGLGINGLSVLLFHKAHVRIPGVLQRIALCFFFAALLFLFGGRRLLVPAAALLLLGYWALMMLVPVPGYGLGRLDVEGNLAAYIDRAVLGPHTWKHDPGWDPEGLLSTLPAIATTLLGIAAGEILRKDSEERGRLMALMAGGALALSLGLIWSLWFPINKNLWTSSYALFMSGLAAMCLAFCLWIVDVHRWKAWSRPFQWLGTNAIAIFVFADLATLLLLAIKLDAGNGKKRSLYSVIYRTVFDRFTDPRIGSLLFALSFCAIWVGFAWLLYRKQIFIKV